MTHAPTSAALAPLLWPECCKRLTLAHDDTFAPPSGCLYLPGVSEAISHAGGTPSRVNVHFIVNDALGLFTACQEAIVTWLGKLGIKSFDDASPPNLRIFIFYPESGSYQDSDGVPFVLVCTEQVTSFTAKAHSVVDAVAPFTRPAEATGVVESGASPVLLKHVLPAHLNGRKLLAAAVRASGIWCMDDIDLDFWVGDMGIACSKVAIVPVLHAAYLESAMLAVRSAAAGSTTATTGLPSTVGVDADIDVLHLGVKNARREKILTQLREVVVASGSDDDGGRGAAGDSGGSANGSAISRNGAALNIHDAYEYDHHRRLALVKRVKIMVIANYYPEPCMYTMHRIMQVFGAGNTALQCVVEECRPGSMAVAALSRSSVARQDGAECSMSTFRSAKFGGDDHVSYEHLARTPCHHTATSRRRGYMMTERLLATWYPAVIIVPYSRIVDTVRQCIQARKDPSYLAEVRLAHARVKAFVDLWASLTPCTTVV
jgi:hypothetical protein